MVEDAIAELFEQEDAKAVAEVIYLAHLRDFLSFFKWGFDFLPE